MRYLLLFFGICFLSTSSFAQFKPTEEGLIILVSDGTEKGKNSELSSKGDIPTSYDQIGQRKGEPAAGVAFTDPIRELGMTDCIQAAAFLERPRYGKLGFMLIFSINDSIGGMQGTHTAAGKTYKGVYRLIRQKTSPSEEVPAGMTSYRIEGTFFLLGIS